MAEAVVTFVLEQLGGLIIESLVQEAKLLYGVSDQVERAKAELARMRCFLKDADARSRGGDERVRNWVAEIREAACDLEDAVLIYVAEVVPRRKRNSFKNSLRRLTCLFNEGVKLHQVGSKMEKISSDIAALTERLQTYGVRQLESGEGGSSSNEMRQRELRRAYSHVVETEIVGIENNVMELVACLTEERKPHRVVSICGMGGLGKTTLARKVYQHSKIRSHFDCVAWASISQQCQVSNVWQEILVKLAPDKKGKIVDAQICGELYKIQKERKCLIVLDDIWTTEMWDRLSNAFPIDQTNSKIVLTTRNKDLALHADRSAFVLEPRCLGDTESWELFSKGFRGSPTNLETEKVKKELGKEMLKHCGGLPLAIIVLRGLLSRKQSILEWEAMQKNAKKYINKGKESDLHDFSGVSWVLGLSYDELPYQLKPCFLHLANFPEDHEIRVNELCQIWMAEGFVSSEDVAYESLYELVQRCMVLEGVLDATDRRIKTCRMHDLMRDLCLSKACDENFLKVVTFLDGQEESYSLSSSNKVRRLAMFFLKQNNVANIQLLSIIGDGCLRSFICFNSMSLSKGKMRPWFKCFYMLRVLKLESQDSSYDRDSLMIPNEIEKLFHLRFLSVRGSVVAPLPSSVTKLRYLQTLDLRVQKNVNWLQLLRNVEMWKSDQLRHLYLPHPIVITDKTFVLENTRNLRTLLGIRTSYPGFNHFRQLIDLARLEIFYDKHFEEGATFNNLRILSVVAWSFEDVYNVTNIILSCPRIYKLKVHSRIEKLPEERQFSSELVKLTLNGTELKEDPLPVLEKLPKLKILRLINAFTVDEIVCSRDGFPRLESLYLSLLMMREWRVENGALPSLCHLTMNSCISLRTIPDGLRYITTLKEIVFEGEESEATRKYKGLDEFNKVRHVPSIVVNTTT